MQDIRLVVVQSGLQKNYVTDITSNVINSHIEGLKLKILIYLLNQKNLKNIAREFDRVNHKFNCIKEHILKYCIVVSQK